MLSVTTYKDKRMVDIQTFKTPPVFDNKAEALLALQNICESHPSSEGWEEFDYGGYVAKHSNGKWYAARCHAKYE